MCSLLAAPSLVLQWLGLPEHSSQRWGSCHCCDPRGGAPGCSHSLRPLSGVQSGVRLLKYQRCLPCLDQGIVVLEGVFGSWGFSSVSGTSGLFVPPAQCVNCIASACTLWSQRSKLLMLSGCQMDMNVLCPSVRSGVWPGTSLAEGSWSSFTNLVSTETGSDCSLICCSPKERKRQLSDSFSLKVAFNLVSWKAKLHFCSSVTCWPQDYVRFNLVCITFFLLFYCNLGSESKKMMQLNFVYYIDFCEVTGRSWFVIQRVLFVEVS